MKFANRLLAVVLLSAAIIFLAASASALILPPVVSIGASPNVTTISSTIVAVASDLSGTGISWVKIYENGTQVKQCSISTCSYVAVHTALGNRSYYAEASDRQGQISRSNTIVVEFQNSAPVLNPIGNFVIYEGSLLQFVVSGYDYNNDSLTYSASPLPYGALFNVTTHAFRWVPNFTQSGVYYVTFSVSDGMLSDSELVRITVLDSSNYTGNDTEAPRWTNLSENPANGSAYAPNRTYEFNVTWTDDSGIASVWAEFNGTSMNVSNNGNVYSFYVNDLAAGTYNYQWHAMDIAGKTNQTSLIGYVVSKAMPALTINMLPSGSVTNGTQTNVSGNGCPNQLTCTLYRNGIAVPNSDVAKLGIGTYNYVFNTTGNENYSSVSASGVLNVYSSGGSGGINNGDNETGDIHTVTDEELRNGHYETLNLNDRLKFILCGTPYYMKLSDIDKEDERAYFKLTPGAMSFILKENEKEEIDLNDDKVNDIVFMLDKIQNSREARVYIKRISDTCGYAPQVNMTYQSQGIDRLGAKESSSNVAYLLAFLMAGVFLLALAILISLLGRVKNKKR